jgi:uncharacterized protein (DUF2141 family)
MPLMLAGSLTELGKAGAQCSANEQGPSIKIEVIGLKDRQGLLKLELYPNDDHDFLGDDAQIVRAGRPFRRVEVAVPQSGQVWMCMRAPGPGTYALSLLHDRDSNHKFGLSLDGVGFPNNPKLGFSKPKAASAAVRVGSGPTVTRVVMNYRHGLFSFGPLK